jgi:hypothetical protein
MRGKTVTKRVGVNTLLNASALGGFLTGMPNSFRIDWPILAIVAGKQPGAVVTGTPPVTHTYTAAGRLRPNEETRKLRERHSNLPGTGQIGSLESSNEAQRPP